MANSARLDAALAAASEASAIIRAHYARAIPARAKADGSPVTDADIAAEQAIRAVVEARFPGDGFYGEETAAERLDAEHVWLVDPIDGTKSFVRGYPMFSTQIAVMHRGRLRARRFLGARLRRNGLGRARRRAHSSTESGSR